MGIKLESDISPDDGFCDDNNDDDDDEHDDEKVDGDVSWL